MFLKWPSIENHYYDENIKKYTDYYTELQNNEMYCITEKLHGTNIQLIIDDEGKRFNIATRNRILSPHEDHYNVQEYVKNWYVKDVLINYAKKTGNDYNWYGEFFGEEKGKSINKGVRYGPLQIRFFGLRINHIMQTQKFIIDLLAELDLSNTFVPIVGKVRGIDNALLVPSSCDSKILLEFSTQKNTMEGVVIQPYNRIVMDKVSNYFIIKKVNEQFRERNRAKKEPIVIDDSINKLHAEYLTYLTENRLQNVFSKEGKISKPEEIGLYIGFMQKDAVTDFLKDFKEVVNLSKKEKKYIFHCGSIIVDLLKKYL